jgi:hypothetical protein
MRRVGRRRPRAPVEPASAVAEEAQRRRIGGAGKESLEREGEQ